MHLTYLIILQTDTLGVFLCVYTPVLDIHDTLGVFLCVYTPEVATPCLRVHADLFTLFFMKCLQAAEGVPDLGHS